MAGAAAAAFAAFAAPAWAGWHEDARLARKGLARAEARGTLAAEDARVYRDDLDAAARARRGMGYSNRLNLGAVLHDVAAQWRGYRPPRAYALFSMLELNTEYLAVHSMPAAGTDVRDEDGITYRAVWGQGLQFHPLANFAHLNRLEATGAQLDAQVLAAALRDRAVPSGRGLVWEYYFPYGGGSPPWTSGMVQAVAAQALFYAGDPVGAHDAFLALPPLLMGLRSGPWVRLYSFSGETVLNAQLQALFSVLQFADMSGNEAAATLAARMNAAVNALFRRFDTGAWSRYSLGGPEANLHYHRYVVLLLNKLEAFTGASIWAQRARRLDSYRFQRPKVRVRVLSRPATDTARIRVWVSKISTVGVRIRGVTTTLVLSRGRHVVTRDVRGLRRGRYAVRVTATDLVGNIGRAHASLRLAS